MKWIINLSNKSQPEIQEALQYCKDFLKTYDTSKLEYVRIDNGRTDYKSFYGRCHYPKGKSGYKVSCQINDTIKFPHRRNQRISPLYFKKKGEYIEGSHDEYERLQDDPDFELGQHIIAYNNGLETSWVRLYKKATYNNFSECLISIFGHEIGHFLSRTKQIPYKNTEIEIDKFEDCFLESYKTRTK